MQDKSKSHHYFTLANNPKHVKVGLGEGLEEKFPEAAARTVDTTHTNDSNQLQQKLAQVASLIEDVSKDVRNLHVCRDLNQPHEEKKMKTVKAPHLMQYSHKVEKKTNLEQIDNLEKKVTLLEWEKRQLAEQIRDVTAMNTRWQLYDGQRDEYVLQLNLKLTALQKQLDELCTQESKAKSKDSVDHADESNKEKIQALEFQVKTSQEDFELERMDRARVQGQLQELKDKFDGAERVNKQQKDLIFFYQAQLGELRRGFNEPDLRAPYLLNINKPRSRYRHQKRFPGGLSDDVEVDEVNDFDVVDSSDSATSTKDQRFIEDNLPLLLDDVEVDGDVAKDEADSGVVELQCPKCSKHFAYCEHDKLVEHMDYC